MRSAAVRYNPTYALMIVMLIIGAMVLTAVPGLLEFSNPLTIENVGGMSAPTPMP